MGGRGLKWAQTDLVNGHTDRSSSCRAIATPYLFIMCQILQDQSRVLRRDAMEIRALSNDVRLRARTLRK